MDERRAASEDDAFHLLKRKKFRPKCKETKSRALASAALFQKVGSD
jgi:hypothetical protein